MTGGPRSAQLRERGYCSALDDPVRLGRCDVSGAGEEQSSLRRVARAAALDQHPGPEQIGSSGKELCAHPHAHRGGLGEKGVGFVVTPEHGGEPTEVIADRSESRAPGGGKLIGPGFELVEQGGRRVWGPCIRWPPLRSRPCRSARVGRGEIEIGRGELLEQPAASAMRSLSTWALANNEANSPRGMSGVSVAISSIRGIRSLMGAALAADDMSCAPKIWGRQVDLLPCRCAALLWLLFGQIGVTGDLCTE